MKPGALVMLLVGAVVTLTGFGLIAVGSLAALANSAQGRDGYLSTATQTFSAQSYALTSPALGPVTETSRVPLNLNIVRVRLEATSTTGDNVFIGIAPQTDVDRYLADVQHTQVRDIQTNPFRAEYTEVPGTVRPAPPTTQNIWVAGAAGPGTQELSWSVQPGSWAIVVMNADASQQVSVDLSAGVHTSLFGAAATGFLWVGVLTIVAGVILVVFGIVGLARRTPPGPVGPGGGYPAVPAPPPPPPSREHEPH